MTAAPLAGRTVVVTRAEDPGGPLSAALRALGADPVLRPLTAIRAADPDDGLRDALARLGEMDWLLLTSSRAVDALAEAGAFESPPPPRLRVAVVGPRTASAVREGGWPVHLVPDEAGAVGLLLALERRGVGRRHRVLFPASARARPLLADGLTARGARVETVAVYAPEPLPQRASDWEPGAGAGGWDALTFTSPSAVEALTGGLPDATVAALRTLPAGVQGPTTAEAARAAGFTTVIQAHPRTFRGLAEALARHLAPASPPPGP